MHFRWTWVYFFLLDYSIISKKSVSLSICVLGAALSFSVKEFQIELVFVFLSLKQMPTVNTSGTPGNVIEWPQSPCSGNVSWTGSNPNQAHCGDEAAILHSCWRWRDDTAVWTDTAQHSGIIHSQGDSCIVTSTKCLLCLTTSMAAKMDSYIQVHPKNPDFWQILHLNYCVTKVTLGIIVLFIDLVFINCHI